MSTYAIVITILIFFYAFYTGFNDGSNAIATTIATRALKPRKAIMIAAVAKFVTPFLIYFLGIWTGSWGMAVASNISDKTIFPSYFEGISQEMAFIFMLTALLGTFVWGITAYIFRIPISTSHTLIGGIIGAGIAAFGFSSIQWTEFVLIYVILMVALSPIIGLVFSFFLMKLFKRLARKAHRRINSVLVAVQQINIVILSGSFASNNAQKGLGIFMMMGVLGLYTYDQTPVWMVFIIAFALTAGLLLGGFRVVNTIGRKIFKMQDLHSVTAQLATSVVMIAATEMGISVSTGQLMSSSVMGVGAAERAHSVKWDMALRIAVSWFLTLPIAALIGGLFYYILGNLILGL
ncbi:MAG: inorganic phosphate transporter [Clostridia bacterium]